MFTRPNGVAVDEEGHIIVADSRNDRVQVWIVKFKNSTVVCWDFNRKCRKLSVVFTNLDLLLLQVFSSAGVFIRTFGSKGTGPGEFDRPSGICISPDGHVIVVDFGNDRVQVF